MPDPQEQDVFLAFWAISPSLPLTPVCQAISKYSPAVRARLARHHERFQEREKELAGVAEG